MGGGKVLEEDFPSNLYKFCFLQYNVGMNLFTKFLRVTEPKRARICGVKFPHITKLVGVRQKDRQHWLIQSRDGDRLQLVHTPSEDTPLLVYAYNIELNCLLGTLDNTLAEKLVYIFGKGFCVDGEILQVTGKKIHGCNIVVYDTRTFMNEED